MKKNFKKDNSGFGNATKKINGIFFVETRSLDFCHATLLFTQSSFKCTLSTNKTVICTLSIEIPYLNYNFPVNNMRVEV